MWHASVSHRGSPVLLMWAALERVACDQLAGVGDAALGEWRERGNIACHVRRRLTISEMKYAGLLDVRDAAGVCGVVDVRGTEEHERRAARIRPFLPVVMRELATEQLT